MLGDSPTGQPFLNVNDLSPTPGPLEPVSEDMEEGELIYNSDNANVRRQQQQQQEPQMSLAAELGVSESPPESPLQERKGEPNGLPPARPSFPQGRVFFPPEKEKGKGKTKVASSAAGGGPSARQPTSRTSAVSSEKENNNAKPRERGATGPKSGTAEAGSTLRKVSPTGGTKTKTATKAAPPASGVMPRTKPSSKPPVAGTGPRRVLINSADAPPIGKGWKG